MGDRIKDFAGLYMRVALGTAFLSAVADRFGLWGAPASSGVAWGDFDAFLAYTATLNPMVPVDLIPLVGWTVTIAETAVGISLIIGFETARSAFLAGCLLLAFAFGMTIGAGIKAPLDASVYSASAGAFLLASMVRYPWSIDSARSRRGEHPPCAPPVHDHRD